MGQHFKNTEAPLGVAGIHGALWELGEHKETGLFVLSEGNLVRSLFLQHGLILFASSTQPEEWLGSYLRHRGHIDTVALDCVAPMMSKKLGKLGSLLVSMGFLTQEELERCIRMHIDWLVANIAPWARATASFETAPLPPDLPAIKGIPASKLVARHVKGIRGENRLLDFVGGPECKLARSQNPVPDDFIEALGSRETGPPVLELVDGNRAIADVLLQSPLAREETLRLLFAFLATGALVPVPPAASATPEEAELEISEGTETWPGDSDAESIIDEFFEIAFDVESAVATGADAIVATAHHVPRQLRGKPTLQDLQQREPETPAEDSSVELPSDLPKLSPDDSVADVQSPEAHVGPARSGVIALGPPAALPAPAPGPSPSLRLALPQPPAPAEASRRPAAFSPVAVPRPAAATPRAAAAAHPPSASARDPLEAAATLVAARNHQRARSVLREAYALNPTAPMAVKCGGLLARNAETLADAIEYVRRAVDLEPAESDYHAQLGLLLIKSENYEEAARSLKRAIVWEPENDFARKLYAEALRLQSGSKKKKGGLLGILGKG
ncbi:MAG: tetratricopeptide repeat protein [Candidatus Schekmanbacteria bacterium]|nr:tetratricopeptide repeat protein [Candidatus Schekmanbacteria bacterium]